MGIIYLERSDPTVDVIVKAAFPAYNGKKITAIITSHVRFSNTNWDESSKREYAIIRLADMASMPVGQASYFRTSDHHTRDHLIPEGHVIVVLIHYRAKETIEIISPAVNLSKLLPAPLELSDDEMTVLLATKAYIASVRYQEARRIKGIGLERYNAAKSLLISRKLLNAAGAITVNGKNAVGSKWL